MKMSKYLNKRIFICLSLALIILIAASFVASSMEEEKGEAGRGGVVLFQDPMGPVTEEEKINFSWNVTQPSSSFYSGKYCVLIERPLKEPILLKKEIIQSSKSFTDNYTDWEVPDDEGWYTAHIRVPCERDEIKGLLTSSTSFKVVKTVLLIKKFNDTNRNGRIDSNDEPLQDWEFKVKYPDGTTKSYSTERNGEKRIEVLDKYAGKDLTVEEILQPGWESILPA
ncbi:MAG: hypothetical protein IMF19_12625, partial [Proteobacteria bacterium]|nr:hypothetical protein [Pseudomonadota bacterium]